MLELADAEVFTVTDLCLFAGEKDHRVNGIIEPGTDHLVIGCYDRALKLLLKQLGVDPDNFSVEYLIFLENDNEAIHQGITSFISHPEASGEHSGFKGSPSFRELKS